MVSRALPLIAILLAGCARSEDAAIVADQNELQAVERVRTPEQDDDDLAIGAWRETLQDEFPALEFGPQGAAPLFSLRCDDRRGLLLQRHGAAPLGDLPMMLIIIGSETRRLAVTSAGGTVPVLRAALPPSDPMLATLAGAESPINIRIGDSPPLAMPPSPAIGGFVTRCETGGGGRSRLAQPADNAAAAANEAEAAEPAPAPAPPPAQR